jgi:hypothetical protein
VADRDEAEGEERVRWTLVRGADRCEAQQTGALVFVRDEIGGVAQETTERCFDDDEAVAWAKRWLDERLAAGWTPSEEMQRADARRRAAVVRRSDAEAATDLLASAGDPQRAVHDYLEFMAADDRGRELLASLCARVTRVEGDGVDPTIRFGGEARLELGGPADAAIGIASVDAVLSHHESGWLYDDDSNQHRLCFGVGAGPPEGDRELDRTELEGSQVTWLVEESPADRYWFVHPTARTAAGEPALCCYEFDGGLHAPVDEPFGTLLLARMLAILEA